MSNKPLLEISNLHVSAGDKEILRGVNLTDRPRRNPCAHGSQRHRQIHAGYAVTGNPAYSVTEGRIVFDGEDITETPVNERAKKGLFLSFQNPHRGAGRNADPHSSAARWSRRAAAACACGTIKKS